MSKIISGLTMMLGIPENPMADNKDHESAFIENNINLFTDLN